MKSLVCLLASLLACASILVAQESPAPVYIGPDAPGWMQLLQSETPNVLEVQKAYDAWYRDHTFEKNTYTQYYKRWLHWARPYAQPDGSLRIPDARETTAMEKKLQALAASDADRTIGPRWDFVGPKRTLVPDAKLQVTWQTNIYSLDIFEKNPNILYAGGETGGVWRTDDKGMHWRLLTTFVLHGSVGAVKVHPDNPDIAFFGTRGRIMKTVNGGKTWQEAYAETDVYATDFAINPAQPDIVLAGTSKGLLLSTDGGQQWTKVFNEQCWTVKFKPGDPSTVFAVRKSGNGTAFMRSDDGGLQFQAVGANWWTPAQDQTVTGALIAVCPSKPDKVYVYQCGSGPTLKGYVGVFTSADNGENWANTNPQNLIGNEPTPYSIPTHTNLMTSNGQFSGFEQGFYDMAIVVNPLNDRELIAGGTSWFKSTDGGATWQALGSYVGGLAWSHPDIQWLAAHGTDLWIASDGGLNYSTDFAQTIEARMNGISGSDMWGFDSGWNEDVLVGGRYHNGNMAWHEDQTDGSFLRMGGAESPTGYVNPGDNKRLYFSDIGGKILSGTAAREVLNFPVGLFPNESYAYYANSEMAWDPRCWNIVYLGKDNAIWRSSDGGVSYDRLHSFPGTADNKVYDIEVSRSNPNVLYCSQWDGVDDSMWRSADGGQSWQKLASLPLPNNNDRVKMALSAENADVLWVLVTYGSNGKKVYRTTDGGQSWTNLTTPTLDGIRLTNIMAQYGTDGGVYLGGVGVVFYRNNAMTDWTPYGYGLPFSAETNRLKPFYRDGKLRNGCWGYGVWEIDLFEPSEVVPQAMCSALEIGCARDTVYFNDYSVTRHEGASWSWDISGASFVGDADTRTPKALFPGPGEYQAVMRLQTSEGTYADTLWLTVGNDCGADARPGNAVSLGGNDAAGYVALPPLDRETNEISVTAWIRPDGIQPDYSAIFMLDGSVAAGFNFLPGSNNIGYHWPGGAWWWNSGLSAPAGEWSHVAMTVSPDSISIYLNGKRATHKITAEMVNFNQGLRLGNYKGWGGRYVKGDLDEVCVYGKKLTQDEVRAKMHLCRIPADDTDLLAYYQFNESEGKAYDKVGVLHGSLVGSAARIPSDAPVGPGQSAKQLATGAGAYDFADAGLWVQWTGAGGLPPTGELWATRIDHAPDVDPGATPDAGQYWVLHYFGQAALFNPATALRLRLGDAPANQDPAAYRLHLREATGHGAVWQQAGAAQAVSGEEVTFSPVADLTGSSQLLLEAPGMAFRRGATPSSVSNSEFQVYPNPVAGDATVQLRAPAGGCYGFRLIDENGRLVRRMEVCDSAGLSLQGLPPGAYRYWWEGSDTLRSGVLVVL